MSTPPSPAPQLLAPAGDWSALKAAVANGAHAVYFGLPNFNARHRATNFSMDELPSVVDYLHSHNTLGLLTFNTLIFSDELPAALEYAHAFISAGIDAVIVQDLGLTLLLHTLCPTLRLHASTQMTLSDPRSIAFVHRLGIKRIVLPRELSLADIAAIRKSTDLELEVFVHGALCVAYSGQCLTSESLGGRSANRGQCAQACRLPYQLFVDNQLRELGDKAYLLSPQDLAAHDLILPLLEAGVDAFKIEGRLKSAHYVAATTQTYRAALDAAKENQAFHIAPQQKVDLEQAFSRGFSHGFLRGVNHQTLVPARFPKARGTKIGSVLQTTPRSIILKLSPQSSVLVTPLKPGDGVVFDQGHPEQDEQGGRIFVVRTLPHQQLEIELGHGDINLAAITPDTLVWKTDDPAIRKRLAHSFARDTIPNRIGIHAHLKAHVGQPLELTFTAQTLTAAVHSDQPLQTAQKHPITEALVRDQLSRLGDTPFELTTMTLDAVGSPMVPKSLLNDLRRQAAQLLIKNRTSRLEISNSQALETLRTQNKSSGHWTLDTGHSPSFYVLARTLEQLHALLTADVPLRPAMVYCDFEDPRRYKDAVAVCRAANMPVALATLRIIKPHEEGLLKIILDAQPDAIVSRNLAALSFFREHAPALPQVGDYSLNIANDLTAGLLHSSGLARMVPSYDLNWQQLTALLAHANPALFEIVIHQHMPMFHNEHCLFAATLSTGKDYHDCGRPCEKHQVDLRDRVGERHPLIPDVGCRNTLFNAVAQSAGEYLPELQRMGIRHYRVELLRESGADAVALVTHYADLLTGKAEPAEALRTLRVLRHMGSVTPGTMTRE